MVLDADLWCLWLEVVVTNNALESLRIGARMTFKPPLARVET